MLNTKYIIRATPHNGDTVIRNTANLGPVWFVDSIQYEPAALEVMNALTRFDPSKKAVLFAGDSTKLAYNPGPDTLRNGKDTANIVLVKPDNDELSYLSQANHRRFAVFSEVYYRRGWRAWIDDKEVPIIRTNYVLRGLSVPPGRHIIRFLFRPLSYYMGRQIQWMATIIFLLMVTGAVIVGLHENSFPRRFVSSPEKCEPLSNAYPAPRSPSKGQ